MFLPFLISNWRLVALGTALMLYPLIYYKGRIDGAESVKTESNKTALEIVVRNNEVRSHRPDDAALIKRLQSGKF